jgi:hypothetical protein
MTVLYAWVTLLMVATGEEHIYGVRVRSNIIVNPATTIYTVTVTALIHVATATTTVTVVPLPITASALPNPICSGNTLT